MAEALKVLAIDQARVSGFAVGIVGGTPKSGTLTVPKCRDDFEYFWQVQQQVGMLIDQYQPDVFAFEQPFFYAKAATNGYKLIGTAGVIKALIHERRIKTVYEFPNLTWKKKFCGTTKFNKKTFPYPPALRAEELGWRTGESNDRADALGLWWCACNKACPDQMQDLPLFS